MCVWKPHDPEGHTHWLEYDEGQDIDACQPCTNLVENEDIDEDINPFTVTAVDSRLRIDVSINTPGTYKLMAGIL